MGIDPFTNGCVIVTTVGDARMVDMSFAEFIDFHPHGVAGATVAAVFAAFPRELVVAVAGLALLSSIGGGLAVAVKDETHREAALITFLVTLSGVTLAGIGSAFWGVVAGAVALAVQRWRL